MTVNTEQIKKELRKNIKNKSWFKGFYTKDERFEKDLDIVIDETFEQLKENPPDITEFQENPTAYAELATEKIFERLGKAETQDQIKRAYAQYEDHQNLQENSKLIEITDFLKLQEDKSTIKKVFEIYPLRKVVDDAWDYVKKEATSARELITKYVKNFSYGSLSKITSPIIFGVGASASALFNNTRYSFPCIFGPLPIEHVEELEIAHSGKVLKFRAQGSVFLAHQVGGKDAMRVSGIMTKEEASWKIPILWALYLICRGKIVEDFEDTPINNYADIDELLEIRKNFDTAFSYDKDIEKPSYRHYYTFPFVTRHGIIPNAFIETFSFEDKTVNGLDVINYDLLLRTYEEPQDLQIYKFDKKNQESNVAFIAPAHDYKSKFNMVSTFVMNSIWRMIQQNELFYDQRSWKRQTECRYETTTEILSFSDYAKLRKGQMSPDEIEETNLVEKLDVYYDIDPGDVAATFSMGIMGYGLS